MDGLPDFVQLLVQPGLGSFQARLAEVDGVGKERTARMDALGITTFLELNSLSFQEFAQVFVKFVFLYWFHKSIPLLISNIPKFELDNNYRTLP